VDGEGERIDREVSWLETPNAGDRPRLDAACRTIGPIVIASRDDDVSTEIALDDLLIATWNAHGGAGSVGALVEAIRAERPDRPSAPFVLLLQEVYRSGSQVPAAVAPGVSVPRAVRPDVSGRTDIVSAARALGLHLVYAPSMRNGRTPGPNGPEDRGNAILSTLPLSEITIIELPLGRYRRVALATTIRIESAAGKAAQAIRVVSLHLDTTGSWRRLYLFSSLHRARQADHVLDAVDETDMLVVGGDLNTWADGPAEPAVERLRRALPDTPPIVWQPTFQRLWRLDYLFFRLPDAWDATSRRLDRTFGSDHHPVLGRIALGR
jgi:endonuclease/exonuclease/phosphatase family metal-dependent hydrolase